MMFASEEIISHIKDTKKLSRNRWHLAYTLLKNPEIAHLRKLGLQKKKRKDSLFLHMASHKLFMKLKHTFNKIEEWSDRLEESFSIDSMLDDHAQIILDKLKLKKMNGNIEENIDFDCTEEKQWKEHENINKNDDTGSLGIPSIKH